MIRPRSFLEIVVKMPALCVFVAMSGGVVGGNLFSKLLRLFGPVSENNLALGTEMCGDVCAYIYIYDWGAGCKSSSHSPP